MTTPTASRELLDRLAAECGDEATQSAALAHTRGRIAALLVELHERRVSDIALAHAVLRGRGIVPSLRLVAKTRKAVKERRLRARRKRKAVSGPGNAPGAGPDQR